MDRELVRALAVPVVTALLGALAVAIEDWRQRRSKAARLRQTIADATQQLAFLRECMLAHKEVVDPEEGRQLKSEIRQAIERIYQEVERTEQVRRKAEDAHRYKREMTGPLTWRGLLLLEPVHSSPVGRVARRLYQGVLVFAFPMIPLMIAMPPVEEGETRAEATLYALVGLLIIFILPLLVLRRLAIRPASISSTRRRRPTVQSHANQRTLT